MSWAFLSVSVDLNLVYDDFGQIFILCLLKGILKSQIHKGVVQGTW